MGAQPKITIGDLFAGAGLFSLAFTDEGAKVRFAIELDRHAAASYARNVGDHVRVASATDIGPAPKVNVIVAGPPCQGFSTLGRRDPKDVRNRLCLVVSRWAKHCQADVVVVENVPPFLESSAWHSMCRALRAQRYEVTTWTLDAADFGVPQRRRRSFTIASRRGLPTKPVASGTQSAQCAFRRIAHRDSMHVWPDASALMSARMRQLPIGGDRRDILKRAPELCPPSWRKIGCQATDVWGRIDPRAPANTIRCDFQNPSKGRYIHPEDNRMISLREGARLQQIPDEWVMLGHRTAITRQIGNGVPLGLGRAVAERVLSLF